MLLDVVLETHAWASSRPKHESKVGVPKVEKKISQVTEVEKEQGMSPLALSSLLSAIFDMSHSIMINENTCLHLHQVARCGHVLLLQNKLGTNARMTRRIRLLYEDCSGYVYWSRSMLVLLSVALTLTVASLSFST